MKAARVAAGLAGLAIVGALGCGADRSPVTGPSDETSAEVEVRVVLAPGLDAFKADGQLVVSYRTDPPFAGESVVGAVPLRAGERSAVGTARVPFVAGTLVARERADAHGVPILCAAVPLADPRTTPTIHLTLAICLS